MIFPTNSSLLKKEFGSSCNLCDESFLTRKRFWEHGEEQHAEKNSAVPVTSVMEDSGQENVFECMERNNMQSNSFSFYKVLLQKMQIKF